MTKTLFVEFGLLWTQNSFDRWQLSGIQNVLLRQLSASMVVVFTLVSFFSGLME